ncbi:hypothetical protein [Streptomyces sp. KL116D]|uniref:hypothetical protein n=1 Tax=Streptomyces sp. KL116D TaxID=3045152 RepID=UPI00355827B3
MTQQVQVGKASNYTDARRAAGSALLNSITDAVKEVEEEGSLDGKISRLHSLAEAYALVAHGKE